MRVQELMSPRVVSVTPDTCVQAMADIFRESRFHHLVVVDGALVVGVISDRDVLRNTSPFVGTPSERRQDEFLLQRRAHQIMTRRPQTIAADAHVGEAGRVMIQGKFSCLPVVEADGRCIGIITIRDIARWAVEHMETTGELTRLSAGASARAA